MSVYNLKLETKKALEAKGQLEKVAKTYRELQQAIEILLLIQNASQKLCAAQGAGDNASTLNLLEARLKLAEMKVIDGIVILAKHFNDQVQAASSCVESHLTSQRLQV